MKFKDAYEKYKRNEASKEERAFVEEQIEQFQALMDICIEDEKLEDQQIQEAVRYDELDMDLYKKIKKTMTRSRCKRIGIIILILCLLPLSFHIWKGLTVYRFSDKEGNETVYSNMNVLGSELYDPEYVRGATTVQKAGFGKYKLSSSDMPVLLKNTKGYGNKSMEYVFTDTFYKRTFFGAGAVYERNGVENFIWNKGDFPMMSMMDYQEPLDAEAIASMPKNTMFSIYIKMDKELTLEEILAMDKEYKDKGIDMGLRWMPIYYGIYPDTKYTNQNSYQYLGFDFHYDQATAYIYDYDRKKYPLLQIADEQYKDGEKQFDEVSAEMYKTHVNSVLNYILDHDDFNSTFKGSLEREEKAKAILENQGIQSDIVYLTISRDALLEVIQNEHVISGCITDTLQTF